MFAILVIIIINSFIIYLLGILYTRHYVMLYAGLSTQTISDLIVYLRKQAYNQTRVDSTVHEL